MAPREEECTVLPLPRGTAGDPAAEEDRDADGMDGECRKLGFLAQVSGDSNLSEASTTHSLEELASPQFLSHQCREIDAMASRVVDEASIRDAVLAVVAGGQFCVSIADPREPDVPLIAISEQFETLTGYTREEMVGRNCRILNQGCPSDPVELMLLRSACESGASYTAVLVNRRKSGDLFFNLLSLRGLTVARNPCTGQELWFLVGLQADVTNAHLPEVQEDQLQKVQEAAACIRAKLTEELSAMALAGALASGFGVRPPPSAAGARSPSPKRGGEGAASIWCLLPAPTWRPGDVSALFGGGHSRWIE